jgi:hypothetical protein
MERNGNAAGVDPQTARRKGQCSPGQNQQHGDVHRISRQSKKTADHP